MGALVQVGLLLLAALATPALSQLDAFALPSAQQYAPKPTVPPEFKSFFELDGHAREFVDSLIGPRPGGFFPEKPFEVASAFTPQASGGHPAPQISQLERGLEQFFTGNPSPGGSQFQLPPGFGQGFSLNNGNQPVASFSQNSQPISAIVDEAVEGSGSEPSSSIHGIPNVFPTLPKVPTRNVDSTPRRVSSDRMPEIPKFLTSPDVPEGGFGPSSEIRRSPASVSDVPSSSATDNSEYGGLNEEEPRSHGGLIGTVFNLLGLNKDKKPLDPKAFAELFTGNRSPLPGKNILSSALYDWMTVGALKDNSTTETNSSAPITLTSAQQAAIGENLEMIQNLITQPSSPLCNPKPEPVSSFNIDAFMGQWYQVVYSPPLSPRPCSMVTYKKMADINNGGVGTIFEIFQYATDGTPYGKPDISSGYAIMKQQGELIFRTSNNQDDVNVHVLAVGPINRNGEYEYAIMSTNCNYPLYVYARDPVAYKQKYEAVVTQELDKLGMVSTFSRILNIIAPVDNSMCSFPPSLFSIRG
uniref:Lipocln_cytosolic_FA-bd_dom domain-containing protein n=1 Tax=Steinernema glaseri TaxID=37863 RepID=A0A1I7ZB72_9BILA